MRKITVILLLLISHFVSGQTFVLNASVTYNTPVVDTLIGPSIVWAGKTTVFLGDSWTNGIAASDNAHRYTNLFSADRGTTQVNNGVNGVTMSPDSCAGYTYYSQAYIPTYSSVTHCALFINLGLNDIGKNVPYQTADRFDSAYNAYLNNAINVKGWPDSLVYIFTPGYIIDYTAWVVACGIVAATSSRALAFNAKIQALATTYNCNYVDIYTPMSVALNSSYYDAGKAHLNDAGMAWLSDWLEAHIRPAVASCPAVLDITTLTNLTENSTGTYTVTSAASDGNGSTSQTISGDGYIYSEYQSSQNTESLAVVWDSLSTLTTSYYATGKFTFFVYAGEYWANYDQEGAINTGIAAVDGDLFGLKRTGSTITARYYRSGAWTTARTFAGTHSTTLYQYISSANDGSTAWKILNLKYCNE